jgi:hypothetical protein
MLKEVYELTVAIISDPEQTNDWRVALQLAGQEYEEAHPGSIVKRKRKSRAPPPASSKRLRQASGDGECRQRDCLCHGLLTAFMFF